MYVKREKVDIVINDEKFFLKQTLTTFKRLCFLGNANKCPKDI